MDQGDQLATDFFKATDAMGKRMLDALDATELQAALDVLGAGGHLRLEVSFAPGVPAPTVHLALLHPGGERASLSYLVLNRTVQ